MLQRVTLRAWGHMQPTVALSSGEAELVAMSHAVKEAMWARNLLKEMGAPIVGPVDEQTDSSAAKDMAAKRTIRAKHFDLKHYFIKDLVSGGTIAVRKLPTVDSPAGLLAKAVTVATLEHPRHFLVQPSSFFSCGGIFCIHRASFCHHSCPWAHVIFRLISYAALEGSIPCIHARFYMTHGCSRA